MADTGLAEFPHLIGWWIEVAPAEPRTHHRLLRRPVQRQRWTWLLKHPDPMMPFGIAIAGSGDAPTEKGAVADAMSKAAWWEDWKVRQEQSRRIDL